MQFSVAAHKYWNYQISVAEKKSNCLFPNQKLSFSPRSPPIVPRVYSQFTRITSIEQRRQYKTEFDKDYSDYMRLHAENERVSRRFAQLEESLRNTDRKNQRYNVSIPYTNPLWYQKKNTHQTHVCTGSLEFVDNSEFRGSSGF